MAKRDYYVILGVSRAEGPSGIKAAYRNLAKRYHPDRVGDRGAEPFREIREAYEVLSDPGRRRAYNRELDRLETGGRARAEPVIRRSPHPGKVEIAPRGILGEPEAVRPSLEALLDRILRNFTAVGATKAERPEGLNFEVVLTPDEAARGVIVPVGVPVFRTCPRCGGSGRVWLYPCVACGQEGMLEREEIVRVRVPPMLRSRTIVELPLRDLGIRNLYLRLHIRIDR